MGITVSLRGGSGDMLKSVYDGNDDGIIALAHTEAKNLLSVLGIDTDLVMGAHNITLGSAQTVDGKDVSDMPQIATGVYTGDGTTSKSVNTSLNTITGIIITRRLYNEPEALIKLNADPANESHVFSDGVVTDHYFSSGFTDGTFYVDDNGDDGFPNSIGVSYEWIAWGT